MTVTKQPEETSSESLVTKQPEETSTVRKQPEETATESLVTKQPKETSTESTVTKQSQKKMHLEESTLSEELQKITAAVVLPESTATAKSTAEPSTVFRFQEPTVTEETTAGPIEETTAEAQSPVKNSRLTEVELFEEELSPSLLPPGFHPTTSSSRPPGGLLRLDSLNIIEDQLDASLLPEGYVLQPEDTRDQLLKPASKSKLAQLKSKYAKSLPPTATADASLIISSSGEIAY